MLLLVLALLIFTLILRWTLKNEEINNQNQNEGELVFRGSLSKQEEKEKEKKTGVDDLHLGGLKSALADGVEDDWGGFQSSSSSSAYECALCCAFAYTRCSRCKTVRYCSSKCQIMHWRQSHKFHCNSLNPNFDHPQPQTSLAIPPRRLSTLTNHPTKNFITTSPTLLSPHSIQNVKPNTLSTENNNNNSSQAFISADAHHLESKQILDLHLSQTEGHQPSRSSKPNVVKTYPPLTHFGNTSLQQPINSPRLPHLGLKTSFQKVVLGFKSPHHNKHRRQNSLYDTSENHNPKEILEYNTFSKWYTSNEVELKPFGLINCGNSCYANAVLQCLAYTRPLTLYLLKGLHSKQCWKEEWCFVCEFEQLIQKAREGYTPLSPIRILSNISHLGHGKEEDAHEFLRYAVETMQSVCLQLTGFVGPAVEETTFISMTFGGYLHSKIKCMKCHYKSEMHERMMDLTVEIDGDIRSLEQALRRFTAYEILDGNNKYHCSRCKSYEKAKKKLSVFQAPNILTIVLKRFQAGTLTKLNKLVHFPHKLDMTPFMSHSSDGYPRYNLYAVVVHLDVKNASFCGHYVCYVKNYHEEWLKIDDSVVRKVNLESVLSEEAYILLYARQSPRPTASTEDASEGKLGNAYIEAVHSRVRGKSDAPKAKSKSYSDPRAVQYQSSRRGYAKDSSYLEEWVTHSVKSIPIPRVNSSSEAEASSLFSYSEEGTCSTPTTKKSASVDDLTDNLFSSAYQSPRAYRQEERKEQNTLY